MSLKAFKGNSHLSSINVDYLIDYEKQAKKKGLSKATIGIYLRPLRAVFNEVIRQRLLDKDKHYPFGKGQYQIPTARKVKKALELTDVQMIYTYRCVNKTSSEQMAKDYWLFSYFGNGMNAKDIAHLLWENLDGDYITFERSKSDWAHRNDPVVITVYVNEDMKAIIERWGNKGPFSEELYFPYSAT